MIRGLVIQGFGGNGIEITGPGGNVIEGNFIGTNAAGTGAQGMPGTVSRSSIRANNTIGGATAAARNVIPGNSGEEVRLDGAPHDRQPDSRQLHRNGCVKVRPLSASSASGVYIGKAPATP